LRAFLSMSAGVNSQCSSAALALSLATMRRKQRGAVERVGIGDDPTTAPPPVAGISRAMLPYAPSGEAI